MKLGEYLSLLFLVILGLIGYALYGSWNTVIYKGNATIPFHDHWGEFFTTPWDKALTFQQGASAFIQYIPYTIAAMFIILLVQRLVFDRFDKHPVWLNGYWLLFFASYLVGSSFIQAAAQYNNWYYTPGQVSGQVDILTHFLAGGMLGGFMVMFNWGFLIKNDRLAGAFRVVVAIALSLLVGIYFEWQESLRPDLYTNEYWNSVQDMWNDVIGATVLAFLNQLIEPDRGEWKR